MTATETVKYLLGLSQFGMRPGLDTVRRLAQYAGSPQDRLRFVHVAGTNGKGSTCAMLESIYRTAGLKVGLYTSPHLVRFSERIQVDRTCIPDCDLARIGSDLRAIVENSLPPENASVTLFEFSTVMALIWFLEQRCDLVIWETGLGGRYDATNLVTPLAAVITNIGWDHQAWLGNTLTAIAAEKAGIIKPAVPVVTGVDRPDALEVIRARATELGAPLRVVSAPADSGIRLGLPGAYQRMNAAVAMALVEALQSVIPVVEPAVREGLARARWFGRFHRIDRPGQTFILDGAHNIPGIAALKTAMQMEFPGRKPALILGMLGDKDWQEMCSQLAPLSERILVCHVESSRSADPEEMRRACERANPQGRVEVCPTVSEALRRAISEPLVLVTGSLYFVGEILPALGMGTAGDPADRGLNEWKSPNEGSAGSELSCLPQK